jgi:hypothetical protein
MEDSDPGKPVAEDALQLGPGNEASHRKEAPYGLGRFHDRELIGRLPA